MEPEGHFKFRRRWCGFPKGFEEVETLDQVP
jgi:hypothetical protein